MPSKISIKGISNGLLIILGEGEWSDVHQALLTQLDQQNEFLEGAKIALDVGNRSLKAADLGKLRDEINDRDISLWAVLSQSAQTERTAEMLGLATQIRKPDSENTKFASEAKHNIGEDALLIQRTLRSGFSLKYAGHVIVFGDVNPGAEIVASGNIFVWGRLRGLAHAGAEGDEGAVVCALDLSPTQLRISDTIAVTPKRRGKPKPEIAQLQDGQVVAETWQPKREKK